MLDTYETHIMTPEALELSNAIRQKASELDELINKMPISRGRSLSLTKLEESVMWANKALALYGVTEE